MPNMEINETSSRIEGFKTVNFKAQQDDDLTVASSGHDNDSDSMHETSIFTSSASILSLSSQVNNDLYDLYQYFMNIAVLAAKKRKSKKHQAGACIVNSKNKVVGVGNYTDHVTIKDEIMSWLKSTPKNDYLNHAETNAIINKKESTLDGCTLFVTTFPCMECAKLIAQSGIRHIVYLSDESSCCQRLTENEIEAIKLLFKLANIGYTKLE